MADITQKGGKRKSLFLEQIIKDYSLVSCVCELFIPEPSLRLNDQGGIEEICGDNDNQGLSRLCRVYLCEVPNVPPDFGMSIQDTDLQSQIYLNVILNGLNSGSLIFEKIDSHKHEIRRKVGNKWRRFLLKFDDKRASKKFITKFENHLTRLESSDVNINTYLLLAVSPGASTTSLLNRQNTNSTASGQSISESESEESSAAEEEEEEEKEEVTKTDKPTLCSLTPPFNPAPFSPTFAANYLHLGLDSIAETEKETTVEKSISDSLTDSLNIHTSELPQSLRSVLRSINKADETGKDGILNVADREPTPDKKIQNDGEVLNSEFMLTENLYIPMGIQTNITMEEKKSPNPVKEEAENVAHLLQTAINDKDVVHAQEYARLLALRDILVTICVKPKSSESEEKSKDFNLKVYIEDKESSGASINLKVKSIDTIGDLKNKMLIKHGFPMEVQNWIVGQRIPPDQQTLAQCRIKTDGHSVYLYLVSAKSVGLSKEDSMRQGSGHLALTDHRSTGQDIPVLERTGSTPATASSQSSRNTSVATPGSAFTLPAPAAAAAQGTPNILDKNLNKKQQKKQPPVNKLPTPNIQTERRPVQVVLGTPQEEPLLGTPNIVPVPQVGRRTPMEHIEIQGWACSACTFINQPTRPGCEVCSNPRPDEYVVPEGYEMSEEERQRLEYERVLERQTEEEQLEERARNYQYLQQTDAQDAIPNTEAFTCPICFDDYSAGEGVVLRECLHTFCRDCLKDAVQYNEEPVLKCPYQDDNFSCDGVLQDREIKAVVTPDMYDKYLARSLSTAESQATNSFHCKTADCPGWCIYEDHVNFFVCPVCRKENCLTCKAIHQGMNCKQYQEDLKIRARNDGAANQTQIMINMMLRDGDAMACPQCQVIVMKKEGCDWIQCSICKTEICWVTKGPRWGPLGNGDISGGCKCRVDGQMCHPNCNNCH